MKLIPVILLFLSQAAFSQPVDSINKRAGNLTADAYQACMERQYEKCIALADSAMKIDSTNWGPYISKAIALWCLGRFADAAVVQKQKMKMKPVEKFIIGEIVLLAMLYDKAGMVSEAREQYANAIKTWEDADPLLKTHPMEEINYLVAFGLLDDTEKWKLKRSVLQEKYPQNIYRPLENKSRQELLDIHFRVYIQ